MARAARSKPARLAEKLLQIRTRLDLSQNGLIRRMGLADEMVREEISAFEHGVRVPPLPVLLKYARVAGVCSDVLLDDEMGLPEKLPSKPRHQLRPSWTSR